DGILVRVGLPVQVAEAEVDIRLAGSDSRRGLELSYGFRSLSQSVQRLTHQHVRRSRVRFSAQDFSKALEGAWISFCCQAGLRKRELQFRVFRIIPCGDLKMSRSFGELLVSVVAEPEQGLCLGIVGSRSHRNFERRNGLMEMSLLEFCQSQVQWDSRQLGIERQGLSI